MSVQLIAERSLTTSIRSQGVLYVLVGCPLSRTGGDRPPGLLAAFVEQGELGDAVLQILLGHDGVPPVDTLGLVPGEDSTGEKHRRGRITRTGNALVRRLLVETAWHYQHRPGVGVALTRRRKGQPNRVIAIADKAQQRLCRRFRRLAEQHKPAPKIAVAIARELAGFLWAALQPAAEPAK